ncbi:glutamate receptor ionotropic, kainate 2-like [Aphidius gifuensis]|uniref:glutamate receptor ionotropic, kainate 2-like n=1 Tax=Aphidius gifuensis TaxID=684658 RepID=UPI001CDD6820|nr:glutamate receptor ionotropic, kainate 2-like [Aphidius gifuensis]
MTGFDLMLMGICIISNTTNCDRNRSLLIDEKRYDWENDMKVVDLSTPTQKLKSKDENLLPKVMKITTLDMPPYSSIYELNGKTMGNVTSYAFYIFDLISKKLNIEYEIVMPDEKIFGDHKKGVIGLLHEKKVDMAVAFLPINPGMHPYVSYSPMLTQIELKAMMKRPDKSALGINFLAPFTKQVWILIVIAVIISGPIFFGIIYLRSYLWKHSKTDNYTFLQCVWFTYGATLKQGSTRTPKTDPIRVLFASWWIFIGLLASFYTANLSAIIYLPKFTLPYHSITDIVKDNRMWSSTSGHYIDYALKQRMIKEDYLKNSRAKMPQNERCKFVIMPEIIYKQPVAFAYPKDSLYQEKFDKKLRNLVEFGIIKHVERRKLPLVPYCPLQLDEDKRTFNMNDLSLPFKILAVLLSIKDTVETLLHVTEVCTHLINNGKCQEESSIGKIRRQTLIMLCQMNPIQSLSISIKCVELCRMPTSAMTLYVLNVLER